MLQIEMFGGRVYRLSRSVTSGDSFAELLLQIETLARRSARPSRSVTAGAEFGPHLLQIEMFVSAAAPRPAVVPYKQTPW